MRNFQPMKGWNKPFDLAACRWPMLGMSKIDGIRAIWNHLEFFSNSSKTLPNRFLQERFRVLADIITGWDGELCDGPPNAPDAYHRTESTVMSRYKPADNVTWYVFDHAGMEHARKPYERRLELLLTSLEGVINPAIRLLEPVTLTEPDHAIAFYEEQLALGFEGIILRAPSGIYKWGRSTFREQYMLKMKPLETVELPILRFEEMEHNNNAPTLDAHGRTKRSSHAANLSPAGSVGAVVCDWRGRELRAGIFKGITRDQLREIWLHQDDYLRKLARIQFFPIGIKDLPRQARCCGFRDPIDL